MLIIYVWDRIYSLANVNEQVALFQENVRLLYDDSCVPVKTKLIKAKHQSWFNDEIRTLIDRRDIEHHIISRRADNYKSFDHFGAAIRHSWTIICGVSSKISVTPTNQRHLTLSRTIFVKPLVNYSCTQSIMCLKI